MPSSPPITLLLDQAALGDRESVDRLFETVYGELKRLAKAHRGQWRGNETINTTALVHEAYLKLVGTERPQWRSRAHFFAVASRAMRHILVNYAERQLADKRGGQERAATLTENVLVTPNVADEVLAIHAALERLASMNERQSRVVECRFFGGLSVPETAEALGVSTATVKRDWALACAWIKQQVKTH